MRWNTWLRGRPAPQRPASFCPQLEALEDRCLLTPVPLTIVALIGNSQRTPVSSIFSTPLEAQVNGQVGVPAVGVQVNFTINPGVSGATARFASGSNTALTFTDANGLAPAPPLFASVTAGDFTVTAMESGDPPPFSSTTFQLTDTPLTPSSIGTVGGTPQTALLGSAYGNLLQVRVTDIFGNLLANVPVTFSAPGSGPSGTFNAFATVPTNALGIATAPQLTANQLKGSFTVTATVAGLSQVASFQLNNIAPPAHLTLFSGGGQSVSVGSAYASLIVLVTDAANQPISGLSVTFSAPGSGPTGTFAAGSSVTVTTDANGRATAPLFTADTVAGTFAVNISAGSLSTTLSLTNKAGKPTQLVFNPALPSTATAGTALGTFQVLIEDADGNVVRSDQNQVSVSLANGSFHVGSSNVATVSVHAVNGVATLSNLVVGPFGSPSNMLRFSDSSDQLQSSSTLTLAAGSPVLLSIKSGQNQSVPIKTAYGPLTVLITDAFGNPVSGVSVTWKVTAGSNGAGASLASSTSMSDATGQATAPTPTANSTAGAFTVSASVVGLPGVTFHLSNQAGSPAQVVVLAGSNQTAVGTRPLFDMGSLERFTTALQAQVLDGSHNGVVGVMVTFTVVPNPSTGAGASFTGHSSVTVLTTASGSAVAPTLTPNGKHGTFTVTATVAGLAGQAVFTLTLP